MTPEQTIADTIRNVTVAVQRAIDEGHRSRMIDADDLVEVLLSVADRLDPPVGTLVDTGYACPGCGERRENHLIWHEDIVRSVGFGTEYIPGCSGRERPTPRRGPRGPHAGSRIAAGRSVPSSRGT